MTVITLTKFEADLICNYDISQQQAVKFADELSGHGVEDIDTFNDALFYQTDSFNPIREFVEMILTDIESVELPFYVVVDHDATWQCNLRHDFFYVEIDGNTFFFNRDF